MVKVALETVDAVRRRLAVEVPAGEVTAEIDRAYDELRRTARVPGFRQGRTPRTVLERLFGDRVRAEVYGRIVSQSCAEALREQRIDPVGRPEIVTESAAPGEPLRYSVTVEVRPVVVVSDYLGLAVERPVRSVSDEDVDRFVENLRESHGQLVPITERQVARRGDIAAVDYEARVGDRIVGRGKERLVEVGEAASDGPGAHLDGAAIGVPVFFDVDYPADYGNPEIAGRRVSMRAVIGALSARELPELDDAFAARIVEGAGLADLRARVRAQLVAAAAGEADAKVRAVLIEKLVTAHDFTVPQAMVDHRAEALVEEFLDQLGPNRPPASKEEALRARLREEMRERARDLVKADLLLEAIAVKEQLEVSEDDVDARVDRLAESAGKARERVRALYRAAEARAVLSSRLRRERALELVAARAKITDMAPSSVAGVSQNG